MTGVPGQLRKEIIETLVQSRYLDSNATLRALFADDSITSWRKSVPEANDRATRASLLFSTFVENFDSRRNNAMVMIMQTMARSEVGATRQNLMRLADDLEVVVGGGTQRTAAPEVVLQRADFTQQEVTVDVVQVATRLYLLRQVKGILAEFSIDVPDSVATEGKELNRTLKDYAERSKERRAQQARTELSQLETPEEKRARLQKELAALGEAKQDF